MKGSAITGPVGKEAAELWPVRSTISPSSNEETNLDTAYRKQLWCRHVKGLFFRGLGMEMGLLLLHGSYEDSDHNNMTHFAARSGYIFRFRSDLRIYVTRTTA